MLIAHLTDPHVGLASNATCPKLDPAEALRRALAHVRALQPAPELLLLTGDLTDSGRAADYTLIRDLLENELPAASAGGPRVLAIPGNHDLREAMRANLDDWLPVAADAPAPWICMHEVHGGLHLIGLDTVVPYQPYGALEGAQLAWLERRLAACAGAPVLIFMHHPPLASGITAMDEFGLRSGREELARLVARHGGVQLIAAGHIHRPIAGVLGGAPVLVAPSTSHQLELDLRPGAPLAVRMEPPMIGLYDWRGPGNLACHLSHVREFDGPYLC